jgi:flagellar motor protein MotB
MIKSVIVIIILTGIFIFTGCSTTDKVTQSEKDQLVSDQKINNLTSQVNKLEDQNKEMEMDIDQKQEKMKQIKILQKRVDDLNGINTALEGKIIEKQKEMDKISMLDSGKEEEIDTLNKEKIFLEERNKSIQREISLINKTIADKSDKIANIKKEINERLENEIKKKYINILTDDGIIILQITDQVMFGPNSSKIKVEFEKTLLLIADILKKIPEKMIRVEGHSARNSETAVSTIENWQISVARATNVVQFFHIKGGIDPERLIAVGYGDNRQIASNASEVGRSKNRRVEIILIDRPLYQFKEIIANN